MYKQNFDEGHKAGFRGSLCRGITVDLSTQEFMRLRVKRKSHQVRKKSQIASIVKVENMQETVNENKEYEIC